MGKARFRVLFVATHPIQYLSPALRRLAGHPKLELSVAYCSLQGAEKGVDPEFGVEVCWDVPLLEGYDWVQVPNRSPHPGLGRSFGLINPQLWRLVTRGKYDAIITQIGYNYLSFWILAGAAKFNGTPFVFVTDASSLNPRDSGGWRAWIKSLVARGIFRISDVIAPGSTAGYEFFRRMGIPEERLVLVPFVLDNEWWTREAAKVDRRAVRASWQVGDHHPVVLFCAKLQPRKRPLDALRAFAQVENENACLVFAGDGPQRSLLESEATALGVADRVRFLGFVNQSRLPGIYSSADLFLLPSEYDPCPVVVCEAMLCGCPVILSDAIHGRFDLVKHGVTGYVYPCGEVDSLARVMREALANPSRLVQMVAAARQRMETWSLRENVAAMVEAIEAAITIKRRRPS